MRSDEKAEKELNSKELESTTVECKGLSNLLIGKSHLGDFGRSIGVFGFYQVMLLIILLASDASYEAAAVLGFLWGIGIIFSIPAALVFSGILFFARALNKDFLRKAAIVWFLLFLRLFWLSCWLSWGRFKGSREVNLNLLKTQ